MKSAPNESAPTVAAQKPEMTTQSAALEAERQAALTQNIGHSVLVQMPDGSVATSEELGRLQADNQEIHVPRRA